MTPVTGIRNRQRSHGKFLVEVQNRDWLTANFPRVRLREREGNIMVDRRSLDVLTGRVIVERFVARRGRVRRLTYSLRMYSYTELRELLLRVGFSSVRAFGEDGDVLNERSSRMILVAGRA
jgi:hypothetical protein